MKILVINAGSSSVKSALFEIDETLGQSQEPLWQGSIDYTRREGFAEIQSATAAGATHNESLPGASSNQACESLLKSLWSGPTQVVTSPHEIRAVGHRVVHGGQEFRRSTRITGEVKDAIQRLVALAPNHNPANLAGIETAERLFEATPQVAVFDTAFHSDLPETAAIYPGPYSWVQEGIRRYGFHGISHHYCSQRAAELLGRNLAGLRLIICHLGNGCSLAAVRDGRSIDTTMGFTPLEGLMMGTRSGSIDPAIVLHLMREKGYTVEAMDAMLNKQSGLLGISGISSDMRTVEEAAAHGDQRARLAIDIFAHRLRSCCGSMLAGLGGLDALVFTAGIGEHSAPVRAALCSAFSFLGWELDETANENSPVDRDIATPASTARILVIHTREEWMIARECWALVYP